MLKRLIEVALPLKEVSEQSAREKAIRHGHISTLHIWWARRPLAACRAAVFASLIPDPDHPECPDQFRKLVMEVLKRNEFKPKNGEGSAVEDTPRNRCLEFVKYLVRCENSDNPEYIEPARKLIAAAHKFLHPDAEGDAPKVLDPFVPILLAFLAVTGVQAAEGQPASVFQAVECEGTYPHHLQGVCTDERESIFWSFTTKLVKTDRAGKVVQQVSVENHHGDLCHHDGKVYVAVNLGRFNDPQGNADSWVYVYDADDLSLLAKYRTPEVFHGAGGIARHDGKFLVVGGLPAGVTENYAYEYDGDFRFVRKHVLQSGHTLMGIQTAAFADGHWWFGCYGDPTILLRTDESLQKVERFEFDCSLGIVPLGERRFLVGRGSCSKEKGCTGRLVLAEADKKQGLVESAAVSFQQGEGRVQIVIGGRPVAEYVTNDEQIADRLQLRL